MWPLAGLHFITPLWPAPASVRAVTTLRGVVDDADPYSGFNLAHHVKDDPRRVQRHRNLLAQALDLTPVQWLDQVHGVDVVDAQGDGIIRCADAVHTAHRDIACAVLTADCLPVLFCNRDGTEAAVAHAGWRGLCAGVLENTVRRFACAPSQLLAWLGPAIGPQAFEVGPEVRDAFFAAFRASPAAMAALNWIDIENCFSASPRTAGNYFADLYALARLRLRAAGVDAVYGGGFCTFSDARFYSFRRAAVTGRLATCIVLR
jgi:YfiH family protein